MDRVTRLPAIPPRPADAHKGTFGKGLVIGGCEGMAGAVAMCADAALRSGAGLVTAAVPRRLLPILAVKTTCPTLRGFPETHEGSFAAHAFGEALAAAADYTAAAIGPGIGRNASTRWFVLNLLQRIACPAVIDADGLNNLSTDVTVLGRRSGPMVLTPHPAEMARLAGIAAADVQRDRERLAAEFAARWKVVLALKGHRTVVTDGRRVYVNETGNPGMATGGTGDVLTGVILGLLCQGIEPFEAAQLGVCLHGLAGDIAARAKGQPSMIATDVLDALPEAFKAHMQTG